MLKGIRVPGLTLNVSGFASCAASALVPMSKTIRKRYSIWMNHSGCGRPGGPPHLAHVLMTARSGSARSSSRAECFVLRFLVGRQHCIEGRVGGGLGRRDLAFERPDLSRD